MKNLAKYKIKPHVTIHDAMVCINKNMHGIALIVDEGDHLIATITDGDLRSAVLRNIDLNSSIDCLIQDQRSLPYPTPITASVGTPPDKLLQLMDKYDIRHIPLIDKKGCIADLAILEELIEKKELPIQAVIMAGGYGKRLLPLTNDLPKPMLLLDGKPIMEYIINQLKLSGIYRIYIATHYKAECITKYFGDGRKFGVEINYVKEKSPLGTAGFLKLIDKPKCTLLIINGDILTNMNFSLMFSFHRKNQAKMTVGVRQYEVQVPYGVVNINGVEINELNEKPTLYYFVNAGVYLLEPEVFQYIPSNDNFNMTDLIKRLVKKGKRVVSFPIYGYWRDIGKYSDYEKAQEDILKGLV